MSEILSSASLIDLTGKSVNASEALAGKVVALYFSASWCGPCKQFTPFLKMFHELARTNSNHFQVVFCSNDKTEEEMIEYFQKHHGDWLAVKFGENTILDLADKMGVKGIPFLAIIDKHGNKVSKDGRMEVVEALRLQQVEDQVTKWRKLVGDWTVGLSEKTGGQQIASDNVSAMREARLRALEARSFSAPPTLHPVQAPVKSSPMHTLPPPGPSAPSAPKTPAPSLHPTHTPKPPHPATPLPSSSTSILQGAGSTPQSVSFQTPATTASLGVNTPQPYTYGGRGEGGEEEEDDDALLQLALAMSLQAFIVVWTIVWDTRWSVLLYPLLSW